MTTFDQASSSRVQAPKRLRTADEKAEARERLKRRHAHMVAAQTAAATEPNALLHIATVCALTGLSRSAIYERTRVADFPAPVRLSARCSRWRAGAVRQWLAQQGPDAA